MSVHEEDIKISEVFSVDESIMHENYENERDDTDTPAIAKKETQTVLGLKLLVMFVLIGAAIAAALIVYFYTANSETSHAEEQFSEFAGKVVESFGATLETAFGAVDVLAASIVSNARITGQTWPQVNTPDFAYRAAKILPLCKSLQLGQAMVVTPEQREVWEAWTLENGAAEIEETLEVMDNDPNFFGPIFHNYTLYGTIFGDFGDINETRIMMPNWHWYPSILQYYPAHNYDYMSASDPTAIVNALETGKVTVSEAFMLPDPSNPIEVEETEIWAEYYADFIAPGEEPNEPISEYYFPLFDNDLSSLQPNSTSGSNVVSMLIGTFYWRDMFKDILPEGADGLVVVVESECAPTFTYMLNGPNPKYLGRGDHHESKFSHLEIRSEGFGIRLSKYTGPPVDEDWCKVGFRMYPSSILEDAYTSNNALTFALGAVTIFIFTSLVFVLYDCSVERRQKVVLTTAQQSSAVVSALFPEAVRNRMYEANLKGNQPQKSGGFRIQNQEKLRMTGNESRPYEGRPNCDLYENTTVFFADIAGFTKWSSTRTPEEVFTLLEALYGAFDKLTKKRHVFKVETIGDCYVAVCGLPRPRTNHALSMCRFAADCLNTASRVFKDLDSVLGQDTSELSLRVGLNSGPTTAGVLRGDKGRFQLFGDTVNTAARMESNGQPGRIHMSQSTADLLIAAGKSKWIQAREDLIEAKGKGKLQTYWVQPASGDEGTTFTEDTPDCSDDYMASSYDGRFRSRSDDGDEAYQDNHDYEGGILVGDDGDIKTMVFDQEAWV